MIRKAYFTALKALSCAIAGTEDRSEKHKKVILEYCIYLATFFAFSSAIFAVVHLVSFLAGWGAPPTYSYWKVVWVTITIAAFLYVTGGLGDPEIEETFYIDDPRARSTFLGGYLATCFVIFIAGFWIAIRLFPIDA